MAERGWRKEPVPFLVAAAHLLSRIETIPCREVVVVAERLDTAVAVGRPNPERTTETPAQRHLRPDERVIRSVVDGRWVIVTPVAAVLGEVR